MLIENRFIPLGTAFCIGRTGVVATAAHNILEAFKHHPRGLQILQKSHFPKNLHLKEIGDPGFSLLHAQSANPATLQVRFWPLETANGLLTESSNDEQPTDLIFGSPLAQRDFPYLPLPISFAIPRIGSKVKCVGYSRTQTPVDGIPLEDLREGHITNWAQYYQHSFRVIEGTVTDIFTQGFAKAYIRGACFAIDVEVEHGQSGGPVFNEEGYVCGVVSAGATKYFSEPASLISLFYPAFMTDITFGRSIGPLRLNFTHPLCALIEKGSIKTDGSEELVTLVPEGKSWRVGPMIHKDDSPRVFDDFGGRQDERPATPDPSGYYRLRNKGRQGKD